MCATNSIYRFFLFTAHSGLCRTVVLLHWCLPVTSQLPNFLIPVSWKAAHIYVSPRDDFLPPVKFYQGRQRNWHHQCMVGQIKLLHIQKTWSIHVAHAQLICCFQEADLLYMHSTVWLSTQLYYTRSSVQKHQTVCAHFVYTCIFYPEKKWQKHVSPGLRTLQLNNSESNFCMKILLHPDL